MNYLENIPKEIIILIIEFTPTDLSNILSNVISLRLTSKKFEFLVKLSFLVQLNPRNEIYTCVNYYGHHNGPQYMLSYNRYNGYVENYNNIVTKEIYEDEQSVMSSVYFINGIKYSTDKWNVYSRSFGFIFNGNKYMTDDIDNLLYNDICNSIYEQMIDVEIIDFFNIFGTCTKMPIKKKYILIRESFPLLEYELENILSEDE